MSFDNLEFIARHHKKLTTAGQPVSRDKFLLVASIIILMAYILLDLVIMYALSRQPFHIAIDALLLAVGIGIFALIHFWSSRYSTRGREHQLLREVMEGSKSSRFITDPVNQIVYANQNYDELCLAGRSGHATFAHFLQLFAASPDQQGHIQGLADQAHRGLHDSLQTAIQRKDATFHYQISVQPVPGWAGYIHWRIDDITEQRELDRAVAEEREKLIDFTDNAPVGFFSVDETGRFVFVNATFARWVGDDIGTLLTTGRLHTYLLDPPEKAAAYDVRNGGGARQSVEVRMKGPSGKAWLASISQSVVIDADGRVRTRAVVYDLTTESAMRQALQASEDRFKRFFEEAPLAIAILDSSGVIEDTNSPLNHLLGMPGNEIEGKNLEGFVAEKDRAAVMAALADTAATDSEGKRGTTPPIEVELLSKTPGSTGAHSTPVTVRVYARRFRESDSIVLHFIDLTQQRSLEAQFVQSQKMQAIGQLAGGVAHDFNNLLTAIIGFCDLLLLRHKPGDPSFSDIMQIQQNSNRAANLVRQLLAFSRQQTLRPQVQDVTDILTEVSHLLRRLIGANIHLDLVHGEDLGLVRVDTHQLEQVLINLAVNARDAMPEGGDLVIRTTGVSNEKTMRRGGDEMPPGHWVSIAVEDAGTGIPPEIMSRIFEPFFTTKDVGQGTGLGLSTVYGIIRQTGGYLHVDSEVGKGTTFTIYLPYADADETPVQSTPIQDDTSGDLTGAALLLLVEDEDAVRTFATRALTNKGYQVMAAESGEAAMALMEEQGFPKIDLLVSDVIMPNMDGPTLAKELREKMPDLKILFMSGYTEEKLKEHMDSRVFFLPKPFTLKQLAAKVKEVLE